MEEPINQTINGRFTQQVKDYQQRHRITQRELCTKWGIDYTYLSNVIHNRKIVSLQMIIAAHQHGQINVNYTLSGSGPIYCRATKTPRE